MATPRLILVTGPAGSGKTTLAGEVAAGIGCPLISRDAIKEGMVASTPGFVPATSDPLTLRTYEVFFATLALLLQAEVTVVAEAAFQHALWVRGLGPLTELADLVALRCSAPLAITQHRMRQRMSRQTTRAAHADADHLARAGPFEPIQLEIPTLDVDTTDGYQPGLAEILAFSRG